jgi:hypothetical protein
VLLAAFGCGIFGISPAVFLFVLFRLLPSTTPALPAAVAEFPFSRTHSEAAWGKAAFIARKKTDRITGNVGTLMRALGNTGFVTNAYRRVVTLLNCQPKDAHRDATSQYHRSCMVHVQLLMQLQCSDLPS